MPYTLPTVADFRARFPSLATVPDARVEYWLANHDPVTDSWFEADYQPAILELTAHNIVTNDEVPATGDTGSLAGVTSFRSASYAVQFSERAANTALDGGYGSTKYGQRFKVHLRRNTGGAFLTGCG